MAERPAARRYGRAALLVRKTLRRFTCITLSHRSGSVSSSLAMMSTPATLTKASICPPPASCATSISCFTASSSLTSHSTKVAGSRPWALIRSATAVPMSTSRSARITRAPSLAKSVAVALPIP